MGLRLCMPRVSCRMDSKMLQGGCRTKGVIRGPCLQRAEFVLEMARLIAGESAAEGG